MATRAALTHDGMILGTVGYMSPEQAAGRPAGLASDQFSFGVILYEMLCGRRPFERDTAVETLSAIIREQPPAIQTLNPGVTSPIQQIVERCLAKNPGDRYAETRQLAVELREIRDRWDRASESGASQALTAPFPVPTTAADAATPAIGVTRRRALWVAGGAVTTMAAGLGVWRLWPSDTGIRVLAVLPFANAADDEDAEYLCDGITESLIQQISRLPSLTVMARSTVFNFKGKTIDPREAGRQLGVDAILTGTVTSRSGRLRITAELVEVATGVQLWGNTYERAAARSRVGSGRDRQRHHGRRHPTAIDGRSSGVSLRAIPPTTRKRTSGTCERGMPWTKARKRASCRRASFWQRATARDPQFALAHTLLAATYVTTALDGFERPADAWLLANVSNRRAVELDSELPAVHAITANIAFLFDWDWTTAEREFEIAIKAPSGLLPTNELLTYTLQRWALGHPDDAVRIVRRIRQADPLTSYFAVLEADLLVPFRAARRRRGPLRKNDPRRAELRTPFSAWRKSDARKAGLTRPSRPGGVVIRPPAMIPCLTSWRGHGVPRDIVRSKGRRLARNSRRSRSRAATAYASPLDFARAHAQLGEAEQAFSYFDAAFADRAPGLVFLKVDRAWDAIRGDPRFVAAVRRVGLP